MPKKQEAQRAKFVRLEDAEAQWLRNRLRELGEESVAEAVGVSTTTVKSLAAGGRVQRTTAKLLRLYMANAPKIEL